LIQRISFERRHYVVIGKLGLGFNNYGFDGSAIKRALSNDLHVFATLANINCHGNYLFTGSFFEPTDAYRGVKTAGICQNYSLGHFSPTI
jgi:hypothetical protein